MSDFDPKYKCEYSSWAHDITINITCYDSEKLLIVEKYLAKALEEIDEKKKVY